MAYVDLLLPHAIIHVHIGLPVAVRYRAKTDDVDRYPVVWQQRVHLEKGETAVDSLRGHQHTGFLSQGFAQPVCCAFLGDFMGCLHQNAGLSLGQCHHLLLVPAHVVHHLPDSHVWGTDAPETG